MPDSCCVPLCCESGYRVEPDGKKITCDCLPSDAVILKVLPSKFSFIKPIVSNLSKSLFFFSSTKCSGGRLIILIILPAIICTHLKYFLHSAQKKLTRDANFKTCNHLDRKK